MSEPFTVDRGGDDRAGDLPVYHLHAQAVADALNKLSVERDEAQVQNAAYVAEVRRAALEEAAKDCDELAASLEPAVVSGDESKENLVFIVGISTAKQLAQSIRVLAERKT